MTSQFSVERDLAQCREVLASAEEALVAALARNDRDAVTAHEAAVAQTTARIDELIGVLDFAARRESVHSAIELRRACWTALRSSTVAPQPLDRPITVTDPARSSSAAVDGEGNSGAVVALGLEEFAVDTGRWGLKNLERRVTSRTVATDTALFGVVEGPAPAVEDFLRTMAADPRLHDYWLLCEHASDTRLFDCGAALSVVDDGLLAHVVNAMRAAAVTGRRYAPPSAINLTRRGAHPLASMPSGLKPHVVVAVGLDGGCGAVHDAARYRAAAKEVSAAVATRGGSMIELFGEAAVAWFPALGGPTAAAAAVDHIQRSVPFAVSAVVFDALCVVDSDTCTAYGPALAAAKELLFEAERLRRPVVFTDAAGERVNRARQPVTRFTAGTVNYFTLARLDQERLEAPPEPDLIKPYNPPPEPDDPAPSVDERAPTKADKVAYVRGTRTSEDLAALFRTIDKGNVGWIGKAAFRDAVAKDPAFPKAVDELAVKSLDGWLARCNKLGAERLGFNEFAIVCLKLDAL